MKRAHIILTTSMKPPRTLNFCLSVLLLLLALFCAGCEELAGGAEQSPPPATQKTDASTLIQAPLRTKVMRLWRDYSRSADEVALEKIIDELTEAIMRHRETIGGVEVVLFANGPNSIWAEMPVKFIWGDAPVIAEFQPDLDNVPPEVKLFREALDKHIREERRKYDERRELLLNNYQARVVEQLKKLKEYLLQRPTVGAPCTQFTSLAERMGKEDLPYNLTITDGWSDCPGEKAATVNAVELHGKHIIIQLPRKTDSQANDGEFLERETFLHKLFPTARIVPASMPSKAVEFMFS